MSLITFFGQALYDFQDLVGSQPNINTYVFKLVLTPLSTRSLEFSDSFQMFLIFTHASAIYSINNYLIPNIATVYAFQSFLLPDTSLHVVAIDVGQSSLDF